MIDSPACVNWKLFWCFLGLLATSTLKSCDQSKWNLANKVSQKNDPRIPFLPHCPLLLSIVQSVNITLKVPWVFPSLKLLFFPFWPQQLFSSSTQQRCPEDPRDSRHWRLFPVLSLHGLWNTESRRNGLNFPLWDKTVHLVLMCHP